MCGPCSGSCFLEAGVGRAETSTAILHGASAGLPASPSACSPTRLLSCHALFCAPVKFQGHTRQYSRVLPALFLGLGGPGCVKDQTQASHLWGPPSAAWPLDVCLSHFSFSTFPRLRGLLTSLPTPKALGDSVRVASLPAPSCGKHCVTESSRASL